MSMMITMSIADDAEDDNDDDDDDCYIFLLIP